MIISLFIICTIYFLQRIITLAIIVFRKYPRKYIDLCCDYSDAMNDCGTCLFVHGVNSKQYRNTSKKANRILKRLRDFDKALPTHYTNKPYANNLNSSNK